MHTQGDLQLRVKDAGDFGLGSSTGVTNLERVEIEATLPGVNPYYIQIEGFFSDTNTYGLDVAVECPTGRPVINEVNLTGGAQFVEITNAGAVEQNLAGVRLEMIEAATGQTYATYALDTATPRLVPGEVMVVGAAVPPDGTPIIALTVPIRAAAGDGMRLVDAAGMVLDAVTFGGVQAGLTEGAVGAPADLGGSAVGRCPNASDTGDNAADFTAVEPTPGSANSCPRVLVCPADDPEEPNDDAAHAFGLGSEPYDSISCSGNPDWIRLDPLPGCVLTARLTFSSADADLDLVLRDLDGVELSRSATGGDAEQLELDAPDLGPFFLEVVSTDGGDALYSLATSTVCPP